MWSVHQSWRCPNFYFLPLVLRPSTFNLFSSLHVIFPFSSNSTMGTQKKEAARRERQGKTGDGMGNVKVKGENFYR